MDYFKKNRISHATFIWDKEKQKVVFQKFQLVTSHLYLSFTGKPLKEMTSLASAVLINHYLKNNNKTISQWRKEKGTYYVAYKEEGRNSKPINYLIISEYIRKNGYFNCYDFDLLPLNEYWLDKGINLFQAFHKSTNKGPHFTLSEWNSETNFGESFPLRPTIAREGVIISSFLSPLLDRCIKKRFKLIEESNNIFSMDWIFDFKDLINDLVSSIDVVLNLVYLKAQFDPLPGWKFDPIKLGQRHGRRLKDKLKWIYQISGNELNIESEKANLFKLKDLRNHLNHYDPPCFALTLEEISNILNSIIDIGLIHLKIRDSLGVNVSSMIVNFILQPEVRFMPEKEFVDRNKMDTMKEGYKTSIWSKKNN